MEVMLNETQFEYTRKVIDKIINELHLDGPLQLLVWIDQASNIVHTTGYNLILD
jgi:hypothetical protein